jgi:hypothetical protein
MTVSAESAGNVAHVVVEGVINDNTASDICTSKGIGPANRRDWTSLKVGMLLVNDRDPMSAAS